MSQRAGILLIIAALLIAPAITPVTAASELSVSLDAPSTPTAGETSSFGVSVTTPDLLGSYTSSATIALFVDGQEVATKTVSITDGETVQTSISHTFSPGGDKSVHAEVGVTLGGQTYSATTPSTTITVSEPVTTLSPQGAALAVPPALQDDIKQLRSSVDTTLPTNAFVLATDSETYLVFTDTDPRVGRASVSGTLLQTPVSIKGVTGGVIVANQTKFSTVGQSVSLGTLAESADTYQYQVVNVSAQHVSVGSLTDPDDGSNLEVASTVGVLVPSNATVKGTNVTGGATTAVIETQRTQTNVSTTLREELPSAPSRVYTISTKTQYWQRTTGSTTGLVLPTGSTAHQFLKQFDTYAAIRSVSGTPILYQMADSDSPTVATLADLQASPAQYENTTVTVSGNVVLGRISVQELSEHSTPCGETLFPVKEACTNIPVDVVISGGIAWNSSNPQGTATVLLGASNHHQDMPTTQLQGEYQITGRVVTTANTGLNITDSYVLIIHNITRTGDISSQGGDSISAKQEEVLSQLQTLVNRTSNAASGTDSTTKSLGDYAGGDNVIDTPDLRSVIKAWVMGGVDTTTLRDAIKAWVMNEPV